MPCKGFESSYCAEDIGVTIAQNRPCDQIHINEQPPKSSHGLKAHEIPYDLSRQTILADLYRLDHVRHVALALYALYPNKSFPWCFRGETTQRGGGTNGTIVRTARGTVI